MQECTWIAENCLDEARKPFGQPMTTGGRFKGVTTYYKALQALYKPQCLLPQTRSSSSIGRDMLYAVLSEADVQFFKSLLGPQGLIVEKAALDSVNLDWMKRYQGKSSLALKPSTTEQVAKILQHCNRRRLAVVPQAGNSGLCGGSIPVFDEVVLLTSGMNEILSFDEVSGALTCQAGCTLESLMEYAGQRGFTIPLDLGAKQCQAGGFVSTNAGGLRLLRYGSLRGSVLGVQAVIPDGTVLDLLEPLRKNNTGYDLKQLFIGGEGTLGVVTAVSILCPPKPAAVHLSYLACPSFSATQQVLMRARQQLGEILSAFEFIDRGALELTLRELQGRVKDPLPHAKTAFYVLIETAGSNQVHDSAKLEAFMGSARSEGLIVDGTIADAPEHVREIWHLREQISVALTQKGPVYKYDLSLPVSKIYGLVEATRDRLEPFPAAEVVAYGHLGDGNVHLNVSVPSYSDDIRSCIEPFVYEYTALYRGSISAEHGLGQMKNDYVGYSKPQSAIQLMGRLKQTFDAQHILNPYKFLPSAYWSSVQSRPRSG